MSKNWRYFLFLLWISYLILSGVFLFSRGFLLTRDEIIKYSECVPQNNIPCNPSVSTSNNITNGHEFHCEKQDKLHSLLTDVDFASKVCFDKKFKVILLIVDALRYDFTEFDEDLENPLPYQNKLPIISEIIKKNPTQTRLFKFIADPPTTTMQRLKALTTGGLPTFIEAGSNFYAPEIMEDNIIEQMVRHNKSVIFMGDDTWGSLYPNGFKRSWKYPSFNVWDLDTVDRGVENQIFTEMKKNDWDLIIAHFLGVDHCGHTFGPDHPEMARKLTEINQNIKKVFEELDNETMLFVIGDHGMTQTGDHGGENEIETNSAMFIYSPIMFNTFDNAKSVKQIDMIPTLSTILGIPIPFSNLGILIFDALPSEKTWHNYLRSLWQNIRQMHDYIKIYSQKSDQFSEENLEYFEHKYENLKGKINKIKSEGQFKSFVKESRELLKFLQNMCIDIWVQFDSFAMTRGLLLLFLTLFFTFLIIDGIPKKKLSNVFLGSFIFFSWFSVIITAILTLIGYFFAFFDNLIHNILFSTGMVSIFLLSTLVVQHWEDIAINWYENVKKSWLDTLTRIILLFAVCTLFSNSYVIDEAIVLSFLIFSLLTFITFTTVTFKFRLAKLKPYAFLIFVGILLRISTYYWTCREEQKWCTNFIRNKTSNTQQCVLSIIILAFLAVFSKLWLKSCGNLTGFSPTILFARYAPSVIVVCSGGYWVLQKMSKEQKNHSQSDNFALVVFFLSFFGIFCAILQPLCVYVFPRAKDTVYDENKLIPQLFKQVKESLSSKNEVLPIVCGLATVFSANFVIVTVFLTLVVCLLLGSVLAPAGVIMYFTAALVLLILASAQLQKNTDSFDVPNWSILTWSLLSIYFFYATNHHSQFSSVHWKSGLVGQLGGGALAFPALLTLLETFCAQALLGLALPMLLVAPLTLQFNGAHNNRPPDNKGEVLLYEQEEKTFDSFFALCCKYFLCHGIRMFACALAATIHCRHLMAWNIFAPKFVFETASLFITLLSVLLSYLLFMRVHTRLGVLLNNLYKRS